eukprot:392578-Prorocentrum_minimum.AAC.3
MKGGSTHRRRLLRGQRLQHPSPPLWGRPLPVGARPPPRARRRAGGDPRQWGHPARLQPLKPLHEAPELAARARPSRPPVDGDTRRGGAAVGTAGLRVRLLSRRGGYRGGGGCPPGPEPDRSRRGPSR